MLGEIVVKLDIKTVDVKFNTRIAGIHLFLHEKNVSLKSFKARCNICTACFDIGKLCFLPTVCIFGFCFVLKKKSFFFSLRHNNGLVLVMETKRVYCEVDIKVVCIDYSYLSL